MSTDFSINRQNDAEALRYRAAADRHYARVAIGRRVEALIVLGSIALGFFAASSSALQVVPALWALAFAVVESSLIYHFVLTNRQAGAQLADCFDRYLFSEVPNLHLPFPASLDAVAADSGRQVGMGDFVDRLSNWYDRRLGAFPREIAHLAALRINAFWDASLRGSYIVGMCAIAGVVAIAALFLFSRNGITPERFVINVLIPFLPATLWFAREVVEQIDARARRRDLEQCIDVLWDATNGIGVSGSIAAEVNYLQTLLFAYRRTDGSVPSWLYRAARMRLHRDITLLMARLVQQRRLHT
ncbi:MAG: S-4TM family putative pore-forming effector [Candidatus Cybelea sp.]|jgi:hypothetical protein